MKRFRVIRTEKLIAGAVVLAILSALAGAFSYQAVAVWHCQQWGRVDFLGQGEVVCHDVAYELGK